MGSSNGGGSGVGRGPKARRAGRSQVESVPQAPTLQVYTVRAPTGELCQLLKITDGAGMMAFSMQLGERERTALAAAFSQPLSDIVVAQAGDVPGV